MDKYSFKSLSDIEEESKKNKKYDFYPIEKCNKKKDKSENSKIVILDKE
jgi:hypothetical protein